MKTQLTVEESAKLIELGVSRSKANGIWLPYVTEVQPFTLIDILDILPKEIRHNGCTYKLNIDYPPIGMVAARYNSEDDDLDSLKGYLCEELIDALYSLLVWCLEKGYVKLD